jgi:hypothetical protein
MTQNDFGCNKDDIYNFSENETNLIIYYKNPIFFSGCPFAHYLQVQSVMNYIRLKTMSENIDFNDMNFIQSECVLAFIEDRNVQNRGEYENEREKRNKK